MLNSDYREMLSILNKEKADYLVIGAYAVVAHGLPRATGDIVFNIAYRGHLQ